MWNTDWQSRRGSPASETDFDAIMSAAHAHVDLPSLVAFRVKAIPPTRKAFLEFGTVRERAPICYRHRLITQPHIGLIQQWHGLSSYSDSANTKLLQHNGS